MVVCSLIEVLDNIVEDSEIQTRFFRARSAWFVARFGSETPEPLARLRCP
jgi:hypothetical protein